MMRTRAATNDAPQLPSGGRSGKGGRRRLPMGLQRESAAETRFDTDVRGTIPMMQSNHRLAASTLASRVGISKGAEHSTGDDDVCVYSGRSCRRCGRGWSAGALARRIS